MKAPLWLKIFLVLFLVSVAFTVLGAISPDLIGPVLVLIPIIFPGKDPERPWLIRLLPWFWGLEIAGSLLFLVLAALGKSWEDNGIRQPTMPELLSTIVILPGLIWALVTRHRLFKSLVIGSTVLFVGLSVWVYWQGAGDIKAKLELGSDLFTQAVITGYLLLKWEPRNDSSRKSKTRKIASST